MSRWESQARQRERRLADLERELLEKSSRMEGLQRQLDESTRQLDDSRRQLEESRRRQVEAEQKLTLRLQECEEELARKAATPPRVKVRKLIRLRILSCYTGCTFSFPEFRLNGFRFFQKQL